MKNIDEYLGKKCNLITKDYLIYEGNVDLKLSEVLNDNKEKVESISIFDFNKWNKIDINDIKAIDILI